MTGDGARIRVLVVDHVSKVLGGAEVNVIELLGHADVRRRWDVTVACAPDSPLDRALEPTGWPRRAHGFASALNELRVVGRRVNPVAKLRGALEVRRASQRLAAVVREVRPQVVLSCTNKDHFAAGAAVRAVGSAGSPGGAGAASVWWVNDLLTADFFPWLVRRAFVSRARSLATALAPVSEAAAAAVVAAGVPRARVRAIPNGIPLARYRRDAARPLRAQLGVPAAEPLFGVVGRITPWKGQDVFVDVARRWRAAGWPGRFAIIGRAFNEDAPYEARLRAAVAAAGLGDVVHFVAFQPDIAAALSSLDVLVHTSVRPEPFGRVLVEAMAVGVPVVGAAAGGVPEIVVDGECGALVGPGDVAGYVAALQRARSSEGVGWAARALERVTQRFTLDRVLDDFDGLFRTAVGWTKRGGRP